MQPQSAQQRISWCRSHAPVVLHLRTLANLMKGVRGASDVTENFFKLIMRLAPLMQINEEDQQDEAGNGDVTTLEEAVSPDVVFARVDKHGTGYITLDEFGEAMKMYQINLNKIGLMKLFLSGDEEAEGLLTPEKFGEIISSFEENMVLSVMDSLGKGMSTLFNAVLVAIAFILLLKYRKFNY